MKDFCKDLREHATKITNCEKLEMLPLTKEEKNHVANKSFVTSTKTNLVKMMTKNIVKFEITVIKQANVEALCIVFVT